jgi:hypothetical protein
MKQSIVLVSLVLFFFVGGLTCYAQSFESQSAAIAAAFNAKNAGALADYFCSTVELVLPGVDSTFPKSQAKNQVADFFGKQQLRSFEILHQGARANVSFIVGKLNTVSGLFRVNMLFKKEGTVLRIYQLRIE